MEKTKRLSKSSIAVIVLSILLVLSMVMGLTGAWFTDRVGGGDQSVLNFGKVELGGTATTVEITESRNTAVNEKTVDGDSFVISAANVANSSDVGVFYRYEYEVELYTTSDGTTPVEKVTAQAEFSHIIDQGSSASTKGVRASFSSSSSSYVDPFITVDEVGYLAAGANFAAALQDKATFTIYFNSNGTANFDEGDPAYILVVRLDVRAIQARNVTQAEVATYLGVSADLAALTTAFGQYNNAEIVQPGA